MVQIFVGAPTPVVLNDCRIAQPAHATALLNQPPPRLLTRLCPHPDLQTLDLDGEHVVAFVPSVSQVVVLNHAAQALLDQMPLTTPVDAARFAGALTAMTQSGILIEDGATPTRAPAPRVLAAWFHITNACNLRCTYCYVSKDHATMDTVTAKAAVDSVIAAAQRHGYNEIALKYAGGEPLLALDVIVSAHTYAMERCRELGLGLQATVLTNGTVLNAERAARICDLGVALTISLDGPAPVHDQLRPTVGGRGSRNAVVAGIEAALSAGLRPGIALTITAANVATAPETVTWLLQHQLPFTISFYRDHTCIQGGMHLQAEEVVLIEGMRAVYAAVAANPPAWSVLGALLDRTDLSHAHAHGCAAGEHYMVIDHHGHVSACQMALATPSATIHDRDPLGAIRLDPRLPLGLSVDQKQGCNSCAWRYWCGGGCALATLRATGRTDVRSPNCAIYTALYPDLLRLEGWRILQHRRQSCG